MVVIDKETSNKYQRNVFASSKTTWLFYVLKPHRNFNHYLKYENTLLLTYTRDKCFLKIISIKSQENNTF